MGLNLINASKHKIWNRNIIWFLFQVFPGSTTLISCKRNDVTPTNVADTLLKMTRKMAISSPSMPFPAAPSSVLSLVNGQLVGLTTLERRGEACLVERWVKIQTSRNEFCRYPWNPWNPWNPAKTGEDPNSFQEALFIVKGAWPKSAFSIPWISRPKNILSKFIILKS